MPCRHRGEPRSWGKVWEAGSVSGVPARGDMGAREFGG